MVKRECVCEVVRERSCGEGQREGVAHAREEVNRGGKRDG